MLVFLCVLTHFEGECSPCCHMGVITGGAGCRLQLYVVYLTISFCFVQPGSGLTRVSAAVSEPRLVVTSCSCGLRLDRLSSSCLSVLIAQVALCLHNAL